MALPKDRRERFRKIFKRIRTKLDELDNIRNKILNDRRNLLSSCKRAMNLIHSGDLSGAKDLVTTIKGKIKEIEKLCPNNSDGELLCLINNILKPVKQELVEVEVLLSIVEDKPIPSPEDLGVGIPIYALGVADVIGELRREILIAISNNDLRLADRFLEWMQILVEEISQFAYPNSLIPIRHKVDVGRSLLDKTFSELLFYKRTGSLL